MKKICTYGIPYIEPLNGSGGWYWGSDYTHGDLYEAEELFRDNHPVRCSRLVFVHAPDGRVMEPVKGREGQYFGRPAFCDGKIQILLIDFQEERIRILQYVDAAEQIALRCELPLSVVRDCYNLNIDQAPVMLTRQGGDGSFQILWPEKAEFKIGENESFFYRDGDKLYFNRWLEDPVYREEVIIRSFPSGEIQECFPGTLWELPDGQKWILQ